MAKTGGLCDAEGNCTGARTGIGLKGVCNVRGGALCDNAFPGLTCTKGKPSGGSWCSCAEGNAGQACGAQMVCSGKPASAPTGGAPTGTPACPAYMDVQCRGVGKYAIYDNQKLPTLTCNKSWTIAITPQLLLGVGGDFPKGSYVCSLPS